MQESRLQIYSRFDIITARMRVRGMARTAGFDNTDQVRIALATWSLANRLGLGELHPGQIVVNRLDNGDCAGIRVTCIKENGALRSLSPEMFGDMRWMVDDLTIDLHPPGIVHVSVVKWANGEERTETQESLRMLV
jgi:hypothetical protein